MEKVARSFLASPDDPGSTGRGESIETLRRVGLLYCDYIEKLATGGDWLKAKCDIERETGEYGLFGDPVLFSSKTGDRISYPRKVMEIAEEMEDILFELAGHKGETIESLKRKTLGEIISFNKRLNDNAR